MSWQEKMKEWGGADIAFLSEDGECITFVVVGEPRLIKGKFKNQDTERIACPLMTQEGFQLLIAGKRLARRLSKHEDDFDTKAFTVVREGVADDISTKYIITFCKNDDLTKMLFEMKAVAKVEVAIDEAVEYAESISKN